MGLQEREASLDGALDGDVIGREDRLGESEFLPERGLELIW